MFCNHSSKGTNTSTSTNKGNISASNPIIIIFQSLKLYTDPSQREVQKVQNLEKREAASQDLII
jgi:hypothetical protein